MEAIIHCNTEDYRRNRKIAKTPEQEISIDDQPNDCVTLAAISPIVAAATGDGGETTETNEDFSGVTI